MDFTLERHPDDPLSPEYREAKPEYWSVRTDDGSFVRVGFVTRTSGPSTLIRAAVTGDGELVAIHGVSSGSDLGAVESSVGTLDRRLPTRCASRARVWRQCTNGVAGSARRRQERC